MLKKCNLLKAVIFEACSGHEGQRDRSIFQIEHAIVVEERRGYVEVGDVSLEFEIIDAAHKVLPRAMRDRDARHFRCEFERLNGPTALHDFEDLRNSDRGRPVDLNQHDDLVGRFACCLCPGPWRSGSCVLYSPVDWN